jgi:hypothetical protein
LANARVAPAATSCSAVKLPVPTPTDSAPMACAAATPWGVADDHHPALVERSTEQRRPTLGAPADERRAVLVVAPEAAEGEPIVDADPLELDPRTLPDVAVPRPTAISRRERARSTVSAMPACTR